MKVTLESRTARQLRALYPQHDAFIRRCEFSWSAEIVAPNQPGPPFRTVVIAEAATLEELSTLLERQKHAR